MPERCSHLRKVIRYLTLFTEENLEDKIVFLNLLVKFKSQNLIGSYIQFNYTNDLKNKTISNNLIEFKGYIKFLKQNIDSIMNGDNSKYKDAIGSLIDEMDGNLLILKKKINHVDRTTPRNTVKYEAGRIYSSQQLKIVLNNVKLLMDFFIENDLFGLIVSNRNKFKHCLIFFANVINLFQICFVIALGIDNLGIRLLFLNFIIINYKNI